jgi:hypothetical protein
MGITWDTNGAVKFNPLRISALKIGGLTPDLFLLDQLLSFEKQGATPQPRRFLQNASREPKRADLADLIACSRVWQAEPGLVFDKTLKFKFELLYTLYKDSVKTRTPISADRS